MYLGKISNNASLLKRDYERGWEILDVSLK